MRRNLFWLSDDQWRQIAPYLPTDVRGKDRVDDRRVISGILHVLKSGCRWCDCPPEYGPPTNMVWKRVRLSPLDFYRARLQSGDDVRVSSPLLYEAAENAVTFDLAGQGSPLISHVLVGLF